MKSSEEWLDNANVLILMNCTLNEGQDNKLYMMYILPQLKKLSFKKWRLYIYIYIPGNISDYH